MKKIACLVLVFAAAASAIAHTYVPHATLVGESVQVRLTKEGGRVTAVFQFEDWGTRDGNVAYFPVFAEEDATPAQILMRSGLEFEFEGRSLGLPEPCDPPARLKRHSGDPRIHWFSVNLDASVGQEVDWSAPILVKVTYLQPLIDDRFYYLPVIPRDERRREEGRQWSFQMSVHSGARHIRVLSTATDFERVGDGVVIFLRDAEMVELQ